MEEILHQAEHLEKEYDWLGATGSYEKALKLHHEDDFSRKGEISECLGYAFYRAAFQAQNNDEFRDRLCQSAVAYEKAVGHYGRLEGSVKAPRTLRSNAMIAYIGYWLASDVPEKKRLLDECWRLTKEALKAFEDAGEALEYGKTYNQLASSAYDGYVFEWSFLDREKMIRDALECGERAITFLSGVGDLHELARAYVKTASYLAIVGWYFDSDMNEKESHHKKSLNYWQKAIELSEESALFELLNIAGESLEWKIDEMLTHYDKALGYAKKTKDKYLAGTALDWLAYVTFRKARVIEDPDKRMEFYQKAFDYATDTMRQFSPISFISPRGINLWTGAPNAGYCYTLAYWETDLRRKRGLLEKAVMDGTCAVKQAEKTGYPDMIKCTHNILRGALVSLAKMEPDLAEKKKLLEKALEHGKESMALSDQLERFFYWNLGVSCHGLANLKAELSDVESDVENKKKMLEEAVSYKERGLQLCIKYNSYYETTGDLSLFASIGHFQYTYGELLNRLYGLTNDTEHQRRATKAFEEAAQSNQKVNLISRMAECHWKAARSCDALGEHFKAAENFALASNNYMNAAEKIPQFKDFYQDHALYMQAWSEIEKAIHYHERQEYDSAREHHERAATIHKSLKQWNYLAPNYFAWAQVECAEDLSRREKSDEAIQAFEEAAKLFTEAKKSIDTELKEIESSDERTMATNLMKASDLRQEYCLGRVALEEARIFDKKGDHYSSSQRYGSATETFEKVLKELESEQDKKEFKLIINLSRAWQKMMLAEARASPELYMEASQLFEQSSKYSSSEKTSFLTLGHSRFCKALEAGTRFADTRDSDMHDTCSKHLASAANYYIKGDFKNASEYAKATELLLDAYAHMDSAKKETDPEKKAKLYTITEKVLQASAGSYMQAEHPEKREQVLRLLDKVKEERELALCISEVLHAPTIISATTAFSTPGPTHENAVGLERFEQADIQANLTTPQKELKVGEKLVLEIELVNAGKGHALLVKVAEVIPKGFEVTEKPEMYRVEDSCLNMKGKRLDPLKMEEVRLVLRPKVQGVFPLKPRILYLDENGNAKSHQPEPITITVKELGIKGWLKGER